MRLLKLSAVLAAALMAVACGSSSDDGSSGGAPAGGAGSGQGGSSGQGGGSSGQGGSSSSQGGSSSSQGGTGGGSSGGLAALATGLDDPRGLAVDATGAYVILKAGISTVPLSGGTPKQLAADTGASHLAVDDAGVYWVSSQDSTSIHRVGKDGSGAATLVTASINEGFAVVGGNVYYGFTTDPTMGTEGGIAKVPATGGSPTVVVPAPLTDLSKGNPTLLAAYSSGLVYSLTDLMMSKTTVWHAGLDGSSPTKLIEEDGAGSYHDFKIVDGKLYWTQTGQSSKTTTFHSIALPSGADTTIATLTDDDDEYFAVDAAGIYFGNQMGDAEGVYKLGSDGKASKIADDSALGGGVNGGNPRYLALDAAHLYWIGGGFNDGQAVLHVMAR